MRPEEVKGLGLVMIDVERRRRAMMEELKAKSGSSAMKEWLSRKSIGFVFSAAEAAQDTGVTHGAVSGFIHRLKVKGYVIAGARWGTYELVKDVSDLIVKAASPGGVPGRKMGKGSPTPGELAERLMEIAGQLESLRPPLSSYTTAELLAEIGRRVRHEDI